MEPLKIFLSIVHGTTTAWAFSLVELGYILAIALKFRLVHSVLNTIGKQTEGTGRCQSGILEDEVLTSLFDVCFIRSLFMAL